jgi:hypothetical protein
MAATLAWLFCLFANAESMQVRHAEIHSILIVTISASNKQTEQIYLFAAQNY